MRVTIFFPLFAKISSCITVNNWFYHSGILFKMFENLLYSMRVGKYRELEPTLTRVVADTLLGT